MTRPRSVTLTALVLAWFGIATSASAIMGAFGTGPGLPLPALLLVVLAAFGLASMAAARALWTMKPVGSSLLLIVGAAGVLLSLALPLTLASEVDPAKAWSAALTGSVIVGLLCNWQSRRFGALLARAV